VQTRCMPGLQHAVTVAAPPERVWEVLTEVERWPERIPTVDSVERLDDGPLRVGSRTRLQQPRLPEAVWTVTDVDEGRSFTWESRSRGVAISAGHVVEPHGTTTRLTLSVSLSGPLAPVGWLMTRGLTRRYVETEAASIKRVAEAGAG
jgi:carbon monoxide dehydrogenase subunit G